MGVVAAVCLDMLAISILVVMIASRVDGYKWVRISRVRFGPLSSPLRGESTDHHHGLSEKASQVLSECNGDINMATQLIFQSDEATDDRVRTWNAIAEFLPLSEAALPPRTTKKLQTIAAACATKGKNQGRILDVGAGNGQLVPLLKKAGVKINKQYVGVDISPVMISQLQQKYSGVEAHVGDFADWDQGEVYESILFNGVLQYTDSPLDMILRASSMCKKIIVSHYQGRKFIKEEKDSMGDRIKDMPTREEIIGKLGPDAWAFDEAHSRKESELDDFYLVKLVRR